jgi:hypothetical protein
MPIYRSGNNGVKIFKHGNEGKFVYRYGTLVFRSQPPQWSQSNAFQNMSVTRYLDAAAAPVPNGGVVLIAGGRDWDAYIYMSTVEMYNTSGVRTTVGSLNRAKSFFAGYGYGDKAFFAGGEYKSTSTTNEVEMYNYSGVRTMVTAFSNTWGIQQNAAAEAGGYVLFAGGKDARYPEVYYNLVNAYNQSGVRTVLGTMTETRAQHAGASSMGYAYFGCGLTDGYYTNTIDIYNPSLVRSASVTISQLLGGVAYATKCGTGIIITDGADTAVVHISNSGVRTALSPVSEQSGRVHGTINGKSLLMHNGYNSKSFEVYDANGVKETAPFQLYSVRSGAIATTLGSTMYIFGGSYSGTYYNTVETISYK